MSKPIAVLISDVHYSLPTLELADTALQQAIGKANELKVPLIIAGDLHDTKANLRGECTNALLETFKMSTTDIVVLRGNHDSLNEKSKKTSLQFLEKYAFLINEPDCWPNYINNNKLWLIPYHSDVEELRTRLKTIPEGSTIIMHQGLQGSNSGEYIQDKSALTYDDVKDFRVISGHYHTRQDIKTGSLRKGTVGLFSYIGNPYTLNFGEANDPEKGYQILIDDGTLEFVSSNLRSHKVIEMTYITLENSTTGHFFPDKPIGKLYKEDLVWVKAKGPRRVLSNAKEKIISGMRGFELKNDVRLDLIPTDIREEIQQTNISNEELLDKIIDSYNDISAERKLKLKALWKSCVS